MSLNSSAPNAWCSPPTTITATRSFPHTVEEVMERKDISETLKTKITGENAARLYNLQE